MAPSTKEAQVTDSPKTEEEDLWSSILSDVQNRGKNKLPSCKQIVVLGDNESGKTTIVAKLQGVEDPKKGSGLEYAYIDVRDDYRDDHTRLGVWVMDGDAGHSGLLSYALNEDTFPHTLVVLTVSMTTPWGILEQLQHWASVLADHLDKLKLDTDTRQARRHHIVKMWQEYVEPGDELDPASPMKRSSRTFGDGDTDGDLEDGAPLPSTTLTNNLGLDIVVVVTKTDYIQNLEKEHDFRDEHLDFMQQWIRRFCLQYGAALFYTSAKEDKNCDLLYKYLTHRIYGFSFRTPALVVEKDAVFIPAGWDNMKKISILYENMHSCKPDDYYRQVIAQPATRRTVNRESEIVAEDEQIFLFRMQQLLLAGGCMSTAGLRQGESPLRTPQGKAGPWSPITPGSQSSPKKLDGSKVVNTSSNEGVLANFFNSLLHKKSGSPVAPPAGTPKTPLSLDSSVDKAAMRSDAAAELDRLARGRKNSTDSSTPIADSSSAAPSGIDFNASDC